nr:flocculation protein FLO11-like [Procambarus clarkii]
MPDISTPAATSPLDDASPNRANTLRLTLPAGAQNHYRQLSPPSVVEGILSFPGADDTGEMDGVSITQSSLEKLLNISEGTTPALPSESLNKSNLLHEPHDTAEEHLEDILHQPSESENSFDVRRKVYLQGSNSLNALGLLNSYMFQGNVSRRLGERLGIRDNGLSPTSAQVLPSQPGGLVSTGRQDLSLRPASPRLDPVGDGTKSEISRHITFSEVNVTSSTYAGPAQTPRPLYPAFHSGRPTATTLAPTTIQHNPPILQRPSVSHDQDASQQIVFPNIDSQQQKSHQQTQFELLIQTKTNPNPPLSLKHTTDKLNPKTENKQQIQIESSSVPGGRLYQEDVVRQVSHDPRRRFPRPPSVYSSTASGALRPSPDTSTASGALRPSPDTSTASGALRPSPDTSTASGALRPSPDTSTASGLRTVPGRHGLLGLNRTLHTPAPSTSDSFSFSSSLPATSSPASPTPASFSSASPTPASFSSASPTPASFSSASPTPASFSSASPTPASFSSASPTPDSSPPKNNGEEKASLQLSHTSSHHDVVSHSLIQHSSPSPMQALAVGQVTPYKSTTRAATTATPSVAVPAPTLSPPADYTLSAAVPAPTLSPPADYTPSAAVPAPSLSPPADYTPSAAVPAPTLSPPSDYTPSAALPAPTLSPPAEYTLSAAVPAPTLSPPADYTLSAAVPAPTLSPPADYTPSAAVPAPTLSPPADYTPVPSQVTVIQQGVFKRQVFVSSENVAVTS